MKILLILFLTIYINAITLSTEAENGRKLYAYAKCQNCHGMDQKYRKQGHSNKKVNVASWVATCDNFLNVGWFEEEQQDVEKYLNEVYFKTKKEN